MSFAAKFLTAVLAFVCLSLQRCGCNSDDAAGCGATDATAAAGAGIDIGSTRSSINQYV